MNSILGAVFLIVTWTNPVQYDTNVASYNFYTNTQQVSHITKSCDITGRSMIRRKAILAYECISMSKNNLPKFQQNINESNAHQQNVVNMCGIDYQSYCTDQQILKYQRRIASDKRAEDNMRKCGSYICGKGDSPLQNAKDTANDVWQVLNAGKQILKIF